MSKVHAQLVQMGNSRGIRLPESLIKQAGLTKDVTLELAGSGIVIRAVGHPRAGWEDAFRAMAEAGEDALLDGPTPTVWEKTEWQW